MMDGDLSHRLSWYLTYMKSVRGETDIIEREEMIRAAEEAGTLEEMPEDMQLKIVNAELEFDKKEYPLLPLPWPLRDM